MTLRGGMKTWNLEWNTASRRFGPVEIPQVHRTGRGYLSYLIHSETEAAVIDPSVEPDVYIAQRPYFLVMAASEGPFWRGQRGPCREC